MSDEANIQTWRELLDGKARHLHEQIAGTYLWVQENANGDPEILRNMTSDLYGWLRDLYEHELPLVKILDEADLSLEFAGPATRVAHPRASLVRNSLAKAQSQVTKVTRSIAGVTENKPDQKRFYIKPEFELGFTSLAFNSALRIGLTLPHPDDNNLLDTEDPVFVAINRAVDSIHAVSQSLAEGNTEEEINEIASELIDDPKVRDTAMAAVKDISPSARSQIDSVRLGGRGRKTEEVKPITYESRQKLHHLLSKPPVKSKEIIELSGTIRELDLDNRRFELRNIDDDYILNDVRCIYGEKVKEANARKWLGESVEVQGRVQRDPNGRPRLLRLKQITIKGDDDQMMIDFPEED